MKRYAQLAVLAGALVALTAAAPSELNTDDAVVQPTVAAAAAGFYVELGDFLTLQRRFAAARLAYAEAVRLERADGRLPVDALRRIANAHYFEGDYTGAAITLQTLADEASELDDLEAQVWALADAAWMAGLADAGQGMEAYLEQLERLGQRHSSLGDVLDEIDSKLMQDFTVFAPHLSSW